MATTYGNRWRGVRSLNEGGQAHTLVVEDLSTAGKPTAVLKRLKNVTRLERFAGEVAALEKIDHPNVVKILDHNLNARPPYLVMEYCTGGDLQKAGFAPANAVDVLNCFQQISEGVKAAHAVGVIHRDIKPANILFRTPGGTPVVADFGICYLDEVGQRQTIVDEVVGPHMFIAPELEDGRVEQVAKQSDVYSLGKLLYWMLSGGRIFAREKHRDPDWNLAVKRDDPLLEHINRRVLDFSIVREPKDRFYSAGEMGTAVKLTRDLIAGRYHALTHKTAQKCSFCGAGTYSRYRDTYRNFGISPAGSPELMIFVCGDCGHVQLFRLDLAPNHGWRNER